MLIRTPVSPMECRLLSELLEYQHDGASPTALASATGFARPSVYVLFMRLEAAKLVKAARAGAVRSQVRYRITAKGIKARERFAAEVGLAA